MVIRAAHPDGPGWLDAGACGAGAKGVVDFAQRGGGCGRRARSHTPGKRRCPPPAVVPTGRLSPRRATTVWPPLYIQRRGILVKESHAMAGRVSVILNACAGVPATATDDLGSVCQVLFQQQGIAPGSRSHAVGAKSRSWRSGRCRHAVRRWSLGAAMGPSLPGSALHVMLLFLENIIRALLIFNGLRSPHCQRALLVYHYRKPRGHANMGIARAVFWRWRIPSSTSGPSPKGSGGDPAHTLDDGGPPPLRHVRPRVCARLARAGPPLDGEVAPGRRPCLEPGCALSVGPPPELFPQYPPGIVWPCPDHGRMGRPRAGPPRLSPGAPGPDPAGRTGDAPALSQYALRPGSPHARHTSGSPLPLRPGAGLLGPLARVCAGHAAGRCHACPIRCGAVGAYAHGATRPKRGARDDATTRGPLRGTPVGPPPHDLAQGLVGCRSSGICCR